MEKSSRAKKRQKQRQRKQEQQKQEQQKQEQQKQEQQKQEQQKPQRQPSPEAPQEGTPKPFWTLRRRWIALWGALVGAVTLGAAVLEYATLLPRVTVDAEAPIDPLNPLPISFRITNTGHVTLTNVVPVVGFCSIKIKGAVDLGAYDGGKAVDCNKVRFSAGELPRISDPNFRFTLAMDEKYSVRIENYFRAIPLKVWKDGVELIDIAFIVTYEPGWIPWKREKIFRFTTVKGSDGKLHWQSKQTERG